jgi:CO dehydrogenase/acetyl-CoA synthase alpha subunit
MPQKKSQEEIRAMFAAMRGSHRGGVQNPEGPATNAQLGALSKSNSPLSTGKIGNRPITKGEASKALNINNQQFWMEVVASIQGQKPTDRKVESEVLKLTPVQRLEATEALQRRAFRMGKASPMELPPGQIRDVLQRVKMTTPRL